MSLEGLLLDKTLEAHVALVGPYVGVDEDVALHVGQQGELAPTDATLVLLHPLKSERTWTQGDENCGRRMDANSGCFNFNQLSDLRFILCVLFILFCLHLE